MCVGGFIQVMLRGLIIAKKYRPIISVLLRSVFMCLERWILSRHKQRVKLSEVVNVTMSQTHVNVSVGLNYI